MGSKLTNRVWRLVDKAEARARGDGELLSSVDTKYQIEASPAKEQDTLKASSALKLLEDYSQSYFSALLTELRPPKISPEDFVELVERVEKLQRSHLREPTGEQILALLDKYRVVVPKEVLMSLLQPRAAGRLAARDAAQPPEVPPKWSLLSSKGLHDSAARESQVLYSPSLHYELSRMHHNDKRVRRGLTLLPPRAWRARPGHRAPEKAEIRYRPRTSIGIMGVVSSYGDAFGGEHSGGAFLTQGAGSSSPGGAGAEEALRLSLATARTGRAHSSEQGGTRRRLSTASVRGARHGARPSTQASQRARGEGGEDEDDTRLLTNGELRGQTQQRRSRTAVSSSQGAKLVMHLSSSKAETIGNAGKTAPSNLGRPRQARATKISHTVRAATSDDGASRPWRSSTALAEPAHLCIDACSNTYTVTAYTPRQAAAAVAQRDLGGQRYILNELGSRISMG